MPFFERGAFRLYFEDTGGVGPVVLFLHGAGGNHLSWWQQVPAFQGDFRCISADQRGFGQSPDVPGGPGPAALSEDALALLDHLSVERAAIVSQSMGGWSAVGAAVRRPDRFWGIVLANTVGNLTDPDILSVREKVAERRRGATAVPLAQAAVGPTFRAANPSGAYLYAQVAALNPPRTPEFGERLQAAQTDVAAYVAANVPTMFVTSDEDGLIPEEVVTCVASKVPGSRLLRVAGAGHSVYFEQPELFNREVRAFLEPLRP